VPVEARTDSRISAKRNLCRCCLLQTSHNSATAVWSANLTPRQTCVGTKRVELPAKVVGTALCSRAYAYLTAVDQIDSRIKDHLIALLDTAVDLNLFPKVAYDGDLA
jgi:hypothetical protein